MKMTFRWYGEKDVVTLSQIRQIPNMSGVVTALYDVPAGESWSLNSLTKLKSSCQRENLSFEVIESVPVTEDIKRGTGQRDRHILNYCSTIENLGRLGVRCICYNFMPVFDWLRTNLRKQNEDGSYSLAYYERDMEGLDKKHLSLPGWDESYTPEELSDLLDSYEGMTHEALRENLFYFLERILPVCEKNGIRMAIHPDDPPWDIFGLPRIVSSESDFDKLFSALPSKANGMTFCTGSLGAGRSNNLTEMAAKFALADRIPFAHIRNIIYSGERDFQETAHLTASGSLDIKGIVKSLVRNGFDGYVRPDHGRQLWDEKGRGGYGLYDRALGACYLNGLFEGLEC